MQETNDCERFGKGAYDGASIRCVYRMAASFEMMKLKAPENRSLFIFAFFESMQGNTFF